MDELELSDDQKMCYDSLLDWYKSHKPLITFGGYAGTGKTTLVSKLRNDLPQAARVAFCAFTGKAASVLRSKLSMFDIKRFSGDTISTIHSLIYEPVIVKEEVVDWKLREKLNADLIVVDEASMLGEEIYKDLSSFGIPILAVGDHCQLPPIDGVLNLMSNPDIKLEKVHRFSETNSLMKISIMARMNGYIPHGKYGENVIKIHKNHSLITDFINQSIETNFLDSVILCGFNRTRIDLNKRIRAKMGLKTKYPSVGERVICLKNNKNAKNCPIYNGVLGTMKSCLEYPEYLDVKIEIDGEAKWYKGKISKTTFNNEKPEMYEFIYEEVDEEEDEDKYITKHSKYRKNYRTKTVRVYLDCFDFGYALTVHKSQGSEWDRVLLIEQPCDYWSGPNWKKWLYTGVTRCADQLLLVR